MQVCSGLTLLSLGLHSLLCLFDTTNLVGDRLGCRCYGDDLQPKGSWFESQCPPFFPTSSHVIVADTHTHTRARFFVFQYKDTHLFVLIHTHTFLCVFTHTRACAHAFFYVFTLCSSVQSAQQRFPTNTLGILHDFTVRVCVCVCVSMRACVRACPCVHMFINIQIPHHLCCPCYRLI